MKKTVCALLLAALSCALLVSCAPSFTEIDADAVKSVELTQAPNASIDEAAFVKAYNEATLLGKAEAGYESDTDVTVIIYGEDEVISLFYLDDNKFAVTGSLVDKAYEIESEALANLYTDVVDPEAEFVPMDADKAGTVAFSKNEEAKADLSAIVEAYNEAEFLGDHDTKAENSTDVMLITYSDGKTIFSVSYLGEDTFMVEGTEVKAAYDIKSEELSALYTKTAYPDAEFVAADETKAERVLFTLDSEATADAAAFAKAYNESEFVGNLGDEKLTTDVVLIIYTEDSGSFELTYIEEDLFAVSGSFVERDYIIKSAELLKLYNDAMGK